MSKNKSIFNVKNDNKQSRFVNLKKHNYQNAFHHKEENKYFRLAKSEKHKNENIFINTGSKFQNTIKDEIINKTTKDSPEGFFVDKFASISTVKSFVKFFSTIFFPSLIYSLFTTKNKLKRQNYGPLDSINVTPNISLSSKNHKNSIKSNEYVTVCHYEYFENFDMLQSQIKVLNKEMNQFRKYVHNCLSKNYEVPIEIVYLFESSQCMLSLSQNIADNLQKKNFQKYSKLTNLNSEKIFSIHEDNKILVDLKIIANSQMAYNFFLKSDSSFTNIIKHLVKSQRKEFQPFQFTKLLSDFNKLFHDHSTKFHQGSLNLRKLNKLLHLNSNLKSPSKLTGMYDSYHILFTFDMNDKKSEDKCSLRNNSGDSIKNSKKVINPDVSHSLNKNTVLNSPTSKLNKKSFLVDKIYNQDTSSKIHQLIGESGKLFFDDDLSKKKFIESQKNDQNTYLKYPLSYRT